MVLWSRFGPLHVRHPERPRGFVFVGAAVLVLSACGSPDEGPDGPTTGPTVTDARFDGEFAIRRLEVGGQPVELVLAPTVEIDSRFGDLTVQPGCNTFLGSFTLAGDGTASFTLTGGSDRDCADGDQQDQPVVDALGAVERWTENGSALVLEDSAGTILELEPTG